MMPGKRITKRQMKEDRLVTVALRAFDYFKENVGRMAVAGSAVVFVVAGSMYMVHTKRVTEDRAGLVLSQGDSEFWGGRLTSAQSLFIDATSRFPGTRSGRIALLRLGDTQLLLGKYAEAQESYKQFLRREKKNQLLILSAKKGIAATLEDQRKFADAGNEYKKIAGTLPDGAEKFQILLDSVRCFRSAAKFDEAVPILKQLVADYPDQRGARQAKSLLLELEARVQGAQGGTR